MRVFVPVLIVAVIVVLALWLYPDVEHVEPIPDSTQSQSIEDNLTNIESADNLVEEAEQYIEDITDKGSAALDAQTVDDFVKADQMISIGEEPEVETTTKEKLLQSDVDRSAPITLIQQQEEIVYQTPARILLDAMGELDRPIQYLENGERIDSTVGDLLKQYPQELLENIPVIKNTEHYVITTPDELKNNPTIDPNSEIKIIKKPYRLPTTNVGELLMGEISEDDIFYVRSIDNTDQKGIWGIVQKGLLHNFAKGIAIKRGTAYEKLQVIIPEDADERQADQSSSFLGKLIDEKSRESHVYNFQQGKMGKNPDLIYPGQEIVIIQFSPDELIEIYQHFINHLNS